MKDKITIYTDGSCSPNPGRGGWGAILKYGDHEKEINGGKKSSTNNEMELTAILNALKCLKNKDIPVEIWTDSQYALNAITKWYWSWESNGMKTSTGKAPTNIKIIQEIVENLPNKYEIKWVKAHNGHHYNERVDNLCKLGRNKC